jgi:N-acetylglucosamine-6-sulfatase
VRCAQFFAYIAPHAPHVPATPAPWVWGTPGIPSESPRLPNWNATGTDAHWLIETRPPFDVAMTNYSDELFYRRLLCLISVDDIVRDVVALLESTGQMDNTWIFYTSDHG